MRCQGSGPIEHNKTEESATLLMPSSNTSHPIQISRRELLSVWGTGGLVLAAAGLMSASGCGSGKGKIARESSEEPILGATGLSAIQRIVNLRPLKGVIYKPAPSDYDGTGEGFYYDSDFTNDDFKRLWGPSGRDDIGKLAAAGVNFLHIYDWNQPVSGRTHTNFLNYCAQKRVSIAVPISAWYVQQVQKNAAPAWWFDAFVAEVHTVSPIDAIPGVPNGKRHPAVVMWTIGNEFDKGSLGQTADGIAKTAKAIIDAEKRAGIPASEQLAITSPVSFVIRGATGVEGADATLQLRQAFEANGIGREFESRFIASINSFNPGSDLGLWASTRFPQVTQHMPFCLFELGKEIGRDVKTEDEQGAFYAAQLAAVLPLAKGSGPYLGQCIFSTVDEPWKGGTEATFGIYRIDEPGGDGWGGTTTGEGYPIDRLVEKPAFASMRKAYTAP